MDAVYMLGTGSRRNNEELGYSLRSLAKFCPWVERVFIVGECPSWVTGVTHIPCGDPYTDCKDANLIRKILKVCPHTTDFLCCSDDQLVTRPSEPSDFAPRYLPRVKLAETKWGRRLKDTLARFPDPYYAQPHIWTPMNSDIFRDMVKSYPDWRKGGCTLFSLYLNHAGVAMVPNFDHAFLRSLPLPDVRHLAYSDVAFSNPDFRAALGRMFPTPCKYEAKHG
jgi:hypothetical protein